jgi:RNA polymerase sigma factor FliA
MSVVAIRDGASRSAPAPEAVEEATEERAVVEVVSTGDASSQRSEPASSTSVSSSEAQIAPTPPTPQQVQQLMESCQGMVRSIAWTVHQQLPPHVDLDDVIAYGQLGLAQAAQSFRPERGKFSTYAFYRIRGAILDGLSQMSWFSRHEFYARRYAQMSNELLEVDAREQEVDAEGREERSIEEGAQWFRDVSAQLSVVYLVSTVAADEQGDAPGAQFSDPAAPQPDESISRDELRVRVRELVDALEDDAGDLIRMTYFEGLTLTDAAARLGMSKSWASRLHARTLKRLALALERLGIEGWV